MTCKPKVFTVWLFKKFAKKKKKEEVCPPPPLTRKLWYAESQALPRPPKSISAVQQDHQVIYIQLSPIYLWFCSPKFQLPTAKHGLKILIESSRNKQFIILKLCVVLSRMMKSHTIPLCCQECESSFFQCYHTVYTTCPLDIWQLYQLSDQLSRYQSACVQIAHYFT